MFWGSQKSHGPRARCPGYAGPGGSSLGQAEGRWRWGGRWTRAGWVPAGFARAFARAATSTDGAGETEGWPGWRAELWAERVA